MTAGSSRLRPVIGPLVDWTSHTMVRVGCPVTKEHSRRECLCDPAMPGTRGHAGPLLLSARRARTTCYVRSLP
jgi:hypothetical protein